MVEWRELEHSAQPRHFLSEYGSSLYIQDTHRGRLHETGDRYHLVYSNHGEYTSVLKVSDNLSDLETLVKEILTDV